VTFGFGSRRTNTTLNSQTKKERTMSERLVSERWLTAAAKFEGIIEAHRIVKRGEGDEFDLLLWRLFDEIVAEVDRG
jgi:hypothetical protein